MLDYLDKLQEALKAYPYAYSVVIGAALVMAALILAWVTRCILKRVLNHLGHQNEADAGIKKRIISHLARIIPAAFLASSASFMPDLHEYVLKLITNLAYSFIILTSALAICGMLSLVSAAYARRPDASIRPITGYIQLLKIVVWVMAVAWIVAILIDRNPVILLSGMGVLAGVLLLIFQDTILSVVAGVQIGTNDMVRIGDWIEMPSENADGFVIEVALHTVKVQNWDKTISTVPVRKLITDSFKNWRGMFESGGRRIKRSLFIDQRSVKFMDEEEVGKLEDLMILNDYLARKRKELIEWNSNLAGMGAKPINGRRVTNLGTFRAYVEHYLRKHPEINQDMMLLVRQLQPGSTGIPLEVYCFTRDVRWVQHEKIQADIFDHLLAIMPIFGLRVFQEISDISIHPANQTKE